MSSDKEIPATTSQSTPSKTDVQQLLAKISLVVIHNTLRRFREQQPMTTLLVTNQSSPIILLSRIPTPKQGTVKLSSSFHLYLMGSYLRENPVESCHLHHPSVLLPRSLQRSQQLLQTVDLVLNPVGCLKNPKNNQFLQWLRQVPSPGNLARFDLISLMMMNNNQRVQSIPALGELLNEMSLPTISLCP